MKLSQNFTKTSRDYPSDEVSRNAQLLIRAGFIHKTMAGVYSYLPLGLHVINKIENIVRDELNKIGGQEILMNSLHPKSWWETTGRWDKGIVDVLFQLKSQTNSEYALACSHEEQVTPIIQSYINSYKDLPNYNPEINQYPAALYQIQTKFRDELRSKSGIMRGREFRMKDMYDFHTNQESADSYYQKVLETYHQIYTRMGLKAYAVHASGGMFTSNDSHEFQVICEAGEDEIMYDESTGYSINAEMIDELKAKGQSIPENLKVAKSAEVGNIFKLGTKYTDAFKVKITGENNQQITPIMNCHGIGTSRCMGVIAEIHSDEKGLKWPKSVAPFEYHLITNLDKNNEIVNEQILTLANKFYTGHVRLFEDSGEIVDYDNLDDRNKMPLSEWARHIEILWDDRLKNNLGEKLKDADLIGIPVQIIISKRSLENGGVEVIDRLTGESKIIKINSLN